MIQVYRFVAPNNNRHTEKTDSVLFPCCHPHRYWTDQECQGNGDYL